MIQSPTLSFSPTHPKPFRDLLGGFITALFGGFVVIFFAEAMRNTVSTPVEVERISQFPVLATIPHLQAAAPWVQPQEADVAYGERTSEQAKMPVYRRTEA